MRRKVSVRKPPPRRPAKVRDDPDYLTIPEFCALFQTSRKSWRRHRPFLKTIQFGNRTLIKRAEVERYIDSLEKPAEKAGAPEGIRPPPAPRAPLSSR